MKDIQELLDNFPIKPKLDLEAARLHGESYFRNLAESYAARQQAWLLDAVRALLQASIKK